MTGRLTVRARLTALYGGVSLLAGAALLAITYLLLTQALNGRTLGTEAILDLPSTGVVAAPAVPADAGTMPLSAEQEQELAERMRLAEDLEEQFRDRTLTSLLQQGGIALAGITVAGVWLGWVMAGRTLRPLQQITATARRVADRTLHERIGLTGPKDELRELADTFDDMLARLDTAFDSQRRFVANASHELRTPLAINRTLIEVAVSRPDAPPEVGRLGETLLTINARHERLIEGLLELAGSEQQLVTREPVDLAAVTDRLVTAARPQAAAAGVTVRLSARPTTVIGDPVLLERVVQNLLRNAIDYNVPDGEVTVDCRENRLTVTNSGPAISAYEIPGLFEPFRRLTDRVGSHRGHGLGLSIVRSIVVAHGGTVTAEPGPSGGLVVTVDLGPAGT